MYFFVAEFNKRFLYVLQKQYKLSNSVESLEKRSQRKNGRAFSPSGRCSAAPCCVSQILHLLKIGDIRMHGAVEGRAAFFCGFFWLTCSNDALARKSSGGMS